MSHNGDENFLGKRKRHDAPSTGDKSQARLDRYFASKAPVKKLPIVSAHAAMLDHTVHAIQARCNSTVPLRNKELAETSHCPGQQQSARKETVPIPMFGSSAKEERSCAADKPCPALLPAQLAKESGP